MIVKLFLNPFNQRKLYKKEKYLTANLRLICDLSHFLRKTHTNISTLHTQTHMYILYIRLLMQISRIFIRKNFFHSLKGKHHDNLANIKINNKTENCNCNLNSMHKQTLKTYTLFKCKTTMCVYMYITIIL
jgi:hypothetical protein